MGNYINQVQANLITLVLNGLTVIKFDEDEDADEWGHSLAAACCLQALAQLLGNDILAQVMQFASDNIANQEWKLKYAALMGLGSIVEGPDRV